VIEIAPTFGIPAISKVTLIRPRLFGTIRQGKLTLGALDPCTSLRRRRVGRRPPKRLRC
jgi:hypothetical protein